MLLSDTLIVCVGCLRQREVFSDWYFNICSFIFYFSCLWMQAFVRFCVLVTVTTEVVCVIAKKVTKVSHFCFVHFILTFTELLHRKWLDLNLICFFSQPIGAECEIPAGECQVPGCSGHGRCIEGECHCERGFKGHDCSERKFFFRSLCHTHDVKTLIIYVKPNRRVSAIQISIISTADCMDPTCSSHGTCINGQCYCKFSD